MENFRLEASLKKILFVLLKIYRSLPSLGFYSCRFLPTCSEYAYQALQHYPLFKAGVLILKRLLKCHGYSQGGYEPLI